MSRIQNILDKAEREGAALRTGRLPAAPPPAAPITPITSAAVPVSNEIPTPPSVLDAAAIVPGSASVSVNAAAPEIESYTARLNPLLVAGLAPKCLAAEQYRQLRTRLAHAENAHALRTVLVTSPQKGEGKSITAANLALTMAQELQRRVVIVEADLRKPSVQHLFGLPAGPGLAEYLSGAAELKEVMKFLPAHNLTVITAGMTPTNPAEL